MMSQEYPGIAERFKKPDGFEFLTFESERGTTIRAGRLEHPHARGAVYILQGQREFIEGWYEFISDLYKRGLSVYICERDGEGGSSKNPLNPQFPPSLPHTEHLKDMDLFFRKICPRPKHMPAVLLGNSLGGLYGLHYLKQNPHAFDQAVFCAPPFGKKVKCKRDLIIAFAAVCTSKFLKKDKYTPGAGDWSLEKKSGRPSQSTHDQERAGNLFEWQRHNPDLRMGGPTYGNLLAISQAMKTAKSKGFAEDITTPCTILSAAGDFMVSDTSHHVMAARLPDCKVITLQGAKHNMIMETDEWRNKVLDTVSESVRHATARYARPVEIFMDTRRALALAFSLKPTEHCFRKSAAAIVPPAKAALNFRRFMAG